jgi:hypothetical protein
MRIKSQESRAEILKPRCGSRDKRFETHNDALILSFIKYLQGLLLVMSTGGDIYRDAGHKYQSLPRESGFQKTRKLTL